MQNLTRYLAIPLFALACAIAPSDALAFNSNITGGTVRPGGTVTVTIAFTGDGTTYENLDYIVYDNATFSVTSLVPQGRVSCELLGANNRTYIRAFIAQGEGNPVSSAACIATFLASPNAAPGVYPVGFVIDNSVLPQAYCRPNSANCFVTDGSITVQAAAPAAAPTVAFTAAPTFVSPGGTVTLSWTSTNAGACAPFDGAGTSWPQQGQLPAAGSRTATVPTNATQPITFGLSCQGSGGTTTATSVVSIGAPPPPPAIRPVVRVNPTIDGQRPTGPSTRPSVSAGARAVVYESGAGNLVPGDTNGLQDVFLRDNVTNQTIRVSVSSTGGQVSQVAGDAVVDSAGERVVLTLGTGLAPAGSDAKTVTGGQVHMFNKSQQRTGLVSSAAGTTATPANGPSSTPQISEDGQAIVFTSTATNLTTEPDTNGVADVFLFDVVTGNKTRLSDAAAPTPSATEELSPKAVPGGKTRLPAGGEADRHAKTGPGVHLCSRPASGRVACEVLRGTRMDIVVYSLGDKNSTGTTVTFAAGGGVANGNSNNPVLSGDGRFVFFDSTASNLVPADLNARRDVFRAELAPTGAVARVQRVSVSTLGTESNGDSERPGTCGQGQFVSFESLASNLVASDDGARDAFAKDIASGVIVKLSQPPGGGNANGASSFPAFSPDCSGIAYATAAENIAAGGASGQDDVVAGASPFFARNVTGGWFDLAQSGHGLFVEHLDDERIVASWYTFAPDGRQVWLIGVGPLVGNTVTMAMTMPQNGLFPPAFVPSDVVYTAFGTMTLRFDSCDSGLLTFAFPAPFGSGTMPLRRPELAAGITCSNTAMAAFDGKLARSAPPAVLPTDAVAAPVTKATGPVAALTGSWANPSQLGHGFQMEVLGGDRLVMTWYVFTPTREQLWLIGAGPISGQTATLNMVRPAGGRFIPNFNPAAITAPSVGSITVTALSCTTARVDYALAAPFGSGSIPISRITAVRGVPCVP